MTQRIRRVRERWPRFLSQAVGKDGVVRNRDDREDKKRLRVRSGLQF